MTSRGALGGGVPIVKITVHSEGAQPSLKILALDLLFKCFVLLWLIIHCYMVIETFLIVYYNLLALKLRMTSASLKIWAWLQLEPPLLKFLEITTGLAFRY